VLALVSSTVSGNKAAFGGGVDISTGGHDLSRVYTTLSRTLIAGNTGVVLPTGGGFVEISGGFTSYDYNVLGHSGFTTSQAFRNVLTLKPHDITATSNGIKPTALNAILDTTLKNNGGPTLTHNLIAGSPAIDAAGACGPGTDQRGFFLLVDGNGDNVNTCDSGALEFASAEDPCTVVKPTSGCTVNGVPNQLCQGSSGPDTIVGTQGNDIIFGGGKADVLNGQAGDDVLCGEGGKDKLNGGSGTDILNGGVGADKCKNGETLIGCEL
jgi:Ca2+-binding RTX toxin-like protein